MFKKTNYGFIESNKGKGAKKTYAEIEKAFFDSIITSDNIKKIESAEESYLCKEIRNVGSDLLDHPLSTENNEPWLLVPQTLEEQLEE